MDASTFNAFDTIWLILGAILVFWMQAGFAMVETGFTRAKNAGNIIMKNLMDYAFGSIVFWIIGYSLMFGGDGPIVGSFDLFATGNYDTCGYTLCLILFSVLQQLLSFQVLWQKELSSSLT